MSGSDATRRAEAVRAGAEAAVAPLGLVVEDVTVTPVGKRRLVRVLVDHDLAGLDPADDTSPVEPLSLDAVADATRAVGDALDASDVMGQAPYVLEVSSPGTDRPLTEPRHHRRNVGRLVRLDLQDGTTAAGRLVRAGAQEVTLREDGGQGPERTVALADVTRARVEVEFSRPGDAGPGADEAADQDEEER